MRKQGARTISRTQVASNTPTLTHAVQLHVRQIRDQKTTNSVIAVNLMRVK